MYNPEYDTKERRLADAVERHRRSLYQSAAVIATVATADVIAAADCASHRLDITSTPIYLGIYVLALVSGSLFKSEYDHTKQLLPKYRQARRILRVERQRTAAHVPLRPDQLIHGESFVVRSSEQK